MQNKFTKGNIFCNLYLTNQLPTKKTINHFKTKYYNNLPLNITIQEKHNNITKKDFAQQNSNI